MAVCGTTGTTVSKGENHAHRVTQNWLLLKDDLTSPSKWKKGINLLHLSFKLHPRASEAPHI